MTLSPDPTSFDAQFGVIGEPIDIKPRFAEAEEFPLDKMPARLAGAINAIVDIVQVPVPIAAQSIIAACAMAAQTRINVEMPTREVVPASLFLFTVAGSGERKSSADKLALRPIYEYEKRLREGSQAAEQQYKIAKMAYDSAIATAKRAKGGKEAIRQALENCGEPPIPPALPMLLVDEPTFEGIVRTFDEAYPSIGLFNDDGAGFLGGYSMSDGRDATTGAKLSQIWDGKPIKRVRGTDVTKILDGKRASLHLMVQPGVASKFFGNKALRDQGLMSRMLLAAPKSMRGQRFWREPSANSWKDIEEYHARLTSLLNSAFNRMHPETRQLEFSTPQLQPDARDMWIAFSDHLEKLQAKDGPLAPVGDLASKMAQHALRLAGVISYFEGGETMIREGISAAAMGVGIALGQYYLAEALRLFNAGSVTEDSDNADALIEFIRGEKLEVVGKRWLNRNVTPSHIRPAEVLQRALLILIEHGHLVAIKDRTTTFTARGKEYSERNTYTVIYAKDDD